MHKYIKPKGLVARRQKVKYSLSLEIQKELQREMEELRREINEFKMLILKKLS
ncbi:hypothetical protein [Thermococcus sp.]